MKILIVYSYPNDYGYNSEIYKRVLKGVSAKHDVQILDLYNEEFDPVLRFDRTHRRRDMKEDPETQAYRDLITWAEHVIFIFPIWWGGMPAILKGFIDRVFSKGYAYEYKGLVPIGYFKGKTAWIITTDDAPKLYSKFFQEDYGRVLKKQVLKMTGFTKVKHYSISFLRNSNEKKRLRFLNRIDAISSKL